VTPPVVCDVLVLGARCAGSATAMLLARGGLRVLVIDRARFPSDTISGHMIKPAGVGYLKRWGLLDSLLTTGCPPINGRHVQVGEVELSLAAPPQESLPPLAPRRVVLDALLIEAAIEAGATVWEGTALRGLIQVDGRVAGARVIGGDGRERELTTKLVIGADGRNSLVARLVGAPRYGIIETVSIAYYAYWNGFATDRVEVYFQAGQAGRMVGLFPTHDHQTLIFVQWPVAERTAFKTDIEGNYLATLRTIAPIARLPRRIRRRLNPAGTRPRKPVVPGASPSQPACGASRTGRCRTAP
jgi:2-polyprenyl-6-methoxyphenol hydroxylase-like FAD-dependent oxidoreductase